MMQAVRLLSDFSFDYVHEARGNQLTQYILRNLVMR
jgi:hypothetical protein